MKNRTLLIIFTLISVVSYSQSKKNVQDDNLSDIVAKSIYIYRNSIKDSVSNNHNLSLTDIKENLLTLDTLITIQINEYLKLNNAIKKALTDNDKLILDSLGELHSTLINQLSNLFEKGKIKSENEVWKSISIKHYDINEDEENNLYGTIINNTTEKIELRIKVLNNKNNNFLDKIIQIEPNEFYDLDKVQSNFKPCNYSVFIIIKYFTKNSKLPFTNTALIENIEHKHVSSKFVINITDSEKENNSKPLSTETEKYFKK
jgi:hypothetical protein